MSERRDTSLQGQRVIVIGGGVFGTMHSYLALQRGADVVHLERDVAPRGATVRNFGLVWISGRAPGRELQLALRGRELWSGIARENPGVGFRTNGSLTLASRRDELAVLERAMERGDATERGFEMMSADEVRRKNPALAGEFLGGLYCRQDAAVEPRKSLGVLRAAMQSTGRYEYLPARELVGIGDHEAIDHQGVRHRGDRVYLCLGASLSGFAAELFEGEPLRSVRLQMAETEPLGRELTTSLANGDSLRYYPGFQGLCEGLLAPQNPEAATYAIQLLCQQRLHGGLTIGDTHEPDEGGVFSTSDRPLEIIMEAAKALIGSRMPRIDRRWSGTYHQLSSPRADDIYFRKEVARGVIAVTGAGGRGMTLAPAIAEESFL
jgi:FAD dependent oxidoreductase TIGR03364